MLADPGVDISKDKALQLLSRHNDIPFDPDSAEAKRVLRKIDWRIMPMIFAIYLLQLMVSCLVFTRDRSVAETCASSRTRTVFHSQLSWEFDPIPN